MPQAIKAPDLPEETVMGLLMSIDGGFVHLSCEVEPQEVYAGHLTYKCSGGGFQDWEIVVFNDCNRWEYLSEVRSPEGTVDVFQLREMPSVLSYSPSKNTAWIRYGLPGYLRWMKPVWPGFKGKRSDDLEARLADTDRQKQLLDPRLVELIDAVRDIPAGQDPRFDPRVRAALRAWHDLAAPMFSSSLDMMSE